MSATDRATTASSTATDGECTAWYRAVTLSERLRLRSFVASAASSGSTDNDEAIDHDRLEYCLASWKSQRPFDEPELFLKRLAFDQLSEADLRDLIAEPPDRLRRRVEAVPNWVADVETALSVGTSVAFHGLLTSRQKRYPTIGFLEVASPFITRALLQLEDGATACGRGSGATAFDPATVRSILFPSLASALLPIVNRAMVLELNVARLEGRLTGSTAEERFTSFIARLHTPERRREIFEEYPVLARLIAEQTRRWVEVSLEFLERVVADFATLESAFGGGASLGPLVGVSGGLSDPHHGGRSVAIATFDSGARIVYKPKSLSIVAHFQDLLRWLTAEGFAPGFRTMTVVDRGGYGWMEYASPAECRTHAEVSNFYERSGGLLALLYLTEATDLHAGNLIASGEHPVLIDVEALFHPHRSKPLAAETASADAIASRLVRSSVLRIGLLPERVWANQERDGVDISGLGTADGQMTPHGVPAWEAAGTDTMHLVRRRKAIDADHNRPVLDGRPVDVLDFRSALVRGFQSAYSVMADRKKQLCAPDGPLQPFAHDSVSVFLRSSRTYRRLLRESYHPDVLRDALDRDRLFDLLWVRIREDPDLVEVIRSERDDLWNGDIPCFSVFPDSRDLRFGTGGAVENFFPEPALESVQKVVARLSAADCARQVWFIDASLASLPAALERWPSHPVERSAPASGPKDLLEAACDVARRLDELAIRGTTDDATWIALDPDEHRVWSVGRTGLDLDAGLPGIVLFLAYLGAVTGLDAPTTLARAAVKAMRELAAKRTSSWSRIGAFDGLGGLIYVLSHLSVLWHRPDLAAEADALASSVPALVDQDDEFDLFAGAAGCILALRSLQQCRPSDRVTAVATMCGDHLIRSAQRTSNGIRWPRLSEGPARCKGPASGTVGVALALGALHDWTGVERFRVAAHEALVGERSVSTTAERDGADSSDERGTAQGPLPWIARCRGMDATALYHLCSSPDRMTLSRVQADIERLAGVLLDCGFGRSHSLGCGDLGSLECLRRAAVILESDTLTHATERMAAVIVKTIHQHGWRCATPLGVETPGLLAGLAGIGYGLLLAARPDEVPSVLTLEPPRD